MALKSKKIELTQAFIAAWEEELSLWNVMSDVYKDRDRRRQNLKKMAEKFDMSGVGEALKVLAKDYKITREQLFIQTKFTSLNGQDSRNIPYDKNAKLPIQVQQSFQKSLENLGCSYIDSLVMHSPMGSLDLTMQVWREFEKFVGDGTVKQLGLSNCYDINMLKGVYSQSTIKPSVIQNRFYEDSDYDKEIRKFCKEKNIYYQSFWTLSANIHLLKSKVIVDISQKLTKTPAQVWFRYVTQAHDIVLLTGTKSDTHMKEDLDILDWRLSEESISDMDALI